jgi:hypothetical protein
MKAPEPVILSRHSDHLVCDVPGVSGWDGFEKLYSYLERSWGASCISSADGPDARLWVLRIRNVTLNLEFEDPWGNRIVSTSLESSDLLREIAANLRQRFSAP